MGGGGRPPGHLKQPPRCLSPSESQALPAGLSWRDTGGGIPEGSPTRSVGLRYVWAQQAAATASSWRTRAGTHTHTYARTYARRHASSRAPVSSRPGHASTSSARSISPPTRAHAGRTHSCAHAGRHSSTRTRAHAGQALTGITAHEQQRSPVRTQAGRSPVRTKAGTHALTRTCTRQGLIRAIAPPAATRANAQDGARSVQLHHQRQATSRPAARQPVDAVSRSPAGQQQAAGGSSEQRHHHRQSTPSAGQQQASSAPPSSPPIGHASSRPAGQRVSPTSRPRPASAAVLQRTARRHSQRDRVADGGSTSRGRSLLPHVTVVCFGASRSRIQFNPCVIASTASSFFPTGNVAN